MTELLSLDEALVRILGRVTPLGPEDVELSAAAGRVLAEDARAAVDLPPFPSSAMDGFAVRSEDTPGRLPIVARIAAGVPAPRALEAGEAMAIATGGVVPAGADCVIPIEYVVENDNRVEIPDSVVNGDNVRARGGDVAAGDVVVPRGARLGAAQIGALAAAGLDRVVVGRRPRVAVHRAALERGLAADVLVTSGGVSVGPHDLVRRILSDLGVKEIFWGVAVKPGKPLAFGVRGSTLVFGLPGNPVSSLVGAEVFVQPALLALQGATVPGPVFFEGRLAAAVRRNVHRDEFLRARSAASADGVLLDPVVGQESHMIARAAAADALVLAPRGEGELAAGERVRYLPLA